MRPTTQLRSSLLAAAVSLSLFCPRIQAQTPSLAVEARGGAFELTVRRDAELLPIHRTQSRVSEARLRAVPGSPVLAATWSERDPSGAVTPWYALCIDGKSFHPARPTSYEILLRHARFDPASDVPVVPAFLDGAAAGGRLQVVQYWTQGLEEYRDAIRSLGGEVHFFLANNSNVVEMDATVAASVRALDFVRWVGPYHPAYKLEELLVAEQLRGWSEEVVRRVNILSTRRGSLGQAPILSRIRALGGRVDSVSENTFLLSATLTLQQIADLARMDAVQWIDRWGAAEEDMDIARSFHGSNYVETLAGYTGTGVRVEVMDGGCDTGHPDMQNYVIHTTNVASAHGTCTSGIVLGTGAGNFSARGVMPNAFLTIGYYNNFAGGSRYNHTVELQNPALAYKAVLQSNSWGSSLTTAYNSTSQNMDLILFDNARISILQSQSNQGSQSSRPEAWAKNIISVGGIKHANTESKSDDSWTGGASIGPAADGRIKPDIASFYDSTLCTDQVGTAGYATGNYYSSFGGTSGATPISAGNLGLIYQMWSDGLFGNATPGSTVFDNRPYNTTAKALIINTATQWTFSGTAHDLTRTHQGWGHPDLKTVYDQRNTIYIVDESDVLANLGSTTHNLTVGAGVPAFKATLVYRDNPGTTSSTLHRINNLDLKVTSPGGTIYWGNNGLSAGMVSTSGGSANNVDTVENVILQNPQAGTWQVAVIASELNQDTHLETGALDADYALVVTGVTLGPPPPPTAPAAPSALGATAISTSRIDLAFSDNSGNEDGFRVERSPEGVNWSPLVTLAANANGHSDTGLAAGTTYHYRVLAFNAVGDSAWSNTANATTLTAGPVDDKAIAEQKIAGTVTGTYVNTQSNDGVYESIQERLSGGPSSQRYSYLEHKWTVNVTGGSSVTFHLEAHQTVSTDFDNFVFAWSSDNVNFTNMLTVTKTSDDNVFQTFSLPANLSGTVYIRVRDTDRTPGRKTKDTIRVDNLFIRSQ